MTDNTTVQAETVREVLRRVIAAAPPATFGMSPTTGQEDPQASAYVEGFKDAHDAVAEYLKELTVSPAEALYDEHTEDGWGTAWADLTPDARRGWEVAARLLADAKNDVAEDPNESSEVDDGALACAWATYRSEYGVHASDLTASYKGFTAGWKAAREGDQSGVLR